MKERIKIREVKVIAKAQKPTVRVSGQYSFSTLLLLLLLLLHALSVLTDCAAPWAALPWTLRVSLNVRWASSVSGARHPRAESGSG